MFLFRGEENMNMCLISSLRCVFTFFSLKACRYITAIYITLSDLFGKELYKHICFCSNPLHVHNIVFVIFTLY